MRFLKLAAAAALVLALFAPAAFAGGAACQQHQAAAAGSCPSSMGCPANCQIEAMRLPSGGLVVHYTGTTAETVKFLHAKADAGAGAFCCHTTQKVASNAKCKVDVTKVSNGVLVYVTSTDKQAVDAYEKEYAALSTSTTTSTK